jgi:hypothetical protein
MLARNAVKRGMTCGKRDYKPLIAKPRRQQRSLNEVLPHVEREHGARYPCLRPRHPVLDDYVPEEDRLTLASWPAYIQHVNLVFISAT